MIEHSKGHRKGRLTNIGKKGFFTDSTGQKIYFRELTIQSEIPIGYGQVVDQEAKILIIDRAAMTWWDEMSPEPKLGDTVCVAYATMYVSSAGVLTFRVTDPSLLEVIPQATASSSAGIESYKRINAADFFRRHFAEMEEKAEKK